MKHRYGSEVSDDARPEVDPAVAIYGVIQVAHDLRSDPVLRRLPKIKCRQVSPVWADLRLPSQ